MITTILISIIYVHGHDKKTMLMRNDIWLQSWYSNTCYTRYLAGRELFGEDRQTLMAFFCCSPLMTGTAAHRWDGQTSLTPKMEKQHATEGQEGGMGGRGSRRWTKAAFRGDSERAGVFAQTRCLALACRAYYRKAGNARRRRMTWQA